jgi:hypothetical protein
MRTATYWYQFPRAIGKFLLPFIVVGFILFCLKGSSGG